MTSTDPSSTGNTDTESSDTTTAGLDPDASSGGDDVDADVFLPFAMSGSRIEVRGFSHDGVAVVLELYDRELDTPCEIREGRCRPTSGGLFTGVQCFAGACPKDLLAVRAHVDGCGSAFLDGTTPLSQLATDDFVVRFAHGPTEAVAHSTTLDVFGPAGSDLTDDAFVGFTRSVSVNEQGLGVAYWVGDDGSRVLLAPYATALGELTPVGDRLQPATNGALGYADADCTQPAVYTLGTYDPTKGPLVAIDPDAEVFYAPTGVEAPRTYVLGGDGGCLEFGGFELSSYVAGAPLTHDELPLVSRAVTSFGEVQVEVLTLESGERVGTALPASGSPRSCVPRRVADAFRCLPPFPTDGPPLLTFMDPECTRLASFSEGPFGPENALAYRASAGSCDPGGSLYLRQGMIKPGERFYRTASGCAAGEWNEETNTVSEEADPAAYPAFGPLETF